MPKNAVPKNIGPKSFGPARRGYRCAECGHQTGKWVGRCPDCQAWGTLDEVAPARAALATVVRTGPASPVRPAQRIGEVDVQAACVQPTGISELDRVLGGGLVPGAVVLLAGEPGVGKSTLLLEVAARCARNGRRVLYATGEESAGQVRLRADRTGSMHDELYLAAESDLALVLGHIDALAPRLLIVDSVQTLSTSAVDGVAGGVTQVRAVTSALIAVAKDRGVSVLLVGHVTKDGSVAGPRVLEHLVDVVLQFEGDRHSALRMVRGVKNRFGPADEVGCFELRGDGIAEVPDPTGLFCSHRDVAAPGTAITVTVEGKRPLLAEVQALVAGSALSNPRRAVSGLDSARLAMVLAVLQRRCGQTLYDKEVFAATVGGMRVVEPAADLAVALAVASSARNAIVPAQTVVLGEVGLAGEVRRVSGVGRRLTEATRLGFTRALVPADPGPLPGGIRVTVVEDLDAALRILR